VEDRPTVLVESVRPLEAPQLAGLADAVRDAGFEPAHSLPMERRSAGAVTFIALRLADAASVLLIEKLAVAMRHWVADRVMPQLRERGISSVTVPIYGPDGEVLTEVQVTPQRTPPSRRQRVLVHEVAEGRSMPPLFFPADAHFLSVLLVAVCSHSLAS
jgi:hypothetical protein